MEQEQSSKKRLLVGLVILLVLLILGGLFWYFFGRSPEGGREGELFPFGTPSQDTERTEAGSSDTPAAGEGQQVSEINIEEPMFRQLANVPVLGAYALEREGIEYVRYIERETGHTYEVNVRDGSRKQLTNTTISRIQLADWAQNGNMVVLRHLEQDPLSGRDIIKTRLGRLDLSADSSSGEVGGMVLETLPDDITALSVAPDGKNLFYLVKTTNGVSGSMMNFDTRTKKRVFQNSFSEWLPQLLNDGTVMLTTKPSGKVEGYSYHFDPKTGNLVRLVREKQGLTTLGDGTGSRVLFGENIAKDAVLGVYSKSGFPADEGIVFYEKILLITALPEKCVWLSDNIHTVCGSFITTPSGLIPDLWYQGRLSFADTFWAANTDTDELAFLVDPKKEVGQEFDVMNPLLSVDQNYFIFTNKKDGTLWSMRIIQKQTANTSPVDTSGLSPAELEDVKGSLPQNTKPAQ
ncbi:MAG: hypothetical protein A2942_00750 [Candidatus Lloydbacteria bacterium RIFCSPLOWO2_01_FULL_50_20]|uniref:Dipeptidylpeptidase IV N-terminal domain-containing protein n=1 Tax=Candidatus Lloydbacteria bacterium RIFCSPLOWO2_01_FULL_50_20 TaxID=1798665 RepID=A0A1G2DEZ9_9BACT|nr:MAG: hypothetical protein A2942_00750 [Candidatus Lloydbacteria bacterium RIFCSPLOWO2_01_FULL_50_20]